MEKNFLNVDSMYESIISIFKDAVDNFEKYESIAEEEAWSIACNTEQDMREYCHKKDTRMFGNFCNIRQDWEYTPEFIGSEVKPWGNFDDVVKSIDDGTISDEDLSKFQTWCSDWFFTAFGTFGLKYNFQGLIADMEYEEEGLSVA